MRVAVAGGTGVAGRHAVASLSAAGHDTVVIARSLGVDARTGAGLNAALAGVDAVIDATNPGVQEEVAATAFFTEVASHLQASGARGGVAHMVVLSIVGIEQARGYGYYAASLRHEAAARAGSVPVTVLRATQFHEFPAQVLRMTRKGPVAAVPMMRSQTVAARTVGAALAALATAAPAAAGAGGGGAGGGGAGTVGAGAGEVDLAGPGPAADLPSLARAVLRRWGRRALVVPVPFPGADGRAMRRGALLPPPGARLEGPSFEEWLAGDDVMALAPGAGGSSRS
jgi:uncharacterized protein YbjT (DUF2867 family)